MTPALILGATAVALGAAGAWTVQAWRYEAKIADIQRAHAQAVATAQANHIQALEKASEQTIVYQQQAHQAAEDAASRVAAADVVMRRNRGELDRLRDAIRTRPAPACPMPDTATATSPKPADTIGDVLGECGTALTELARAADGHASDAVMMRNAWPK